MLHKDGLTSSDLRLIQPSYPIWILAWPLTALGGESLNLAQSGEKEKRPRNSRACFHSLASHVSGQTDVSSTSWAMFAGYMDIPKVPWALLGVFCSVSSCDLIFPFMNLWPLPFLWIFPPSTPYSSLPLLLLEYFLPEVCQTLNHLFVWPCSGRNSQQGGGTTKAFLFICLGFVFCFFVVVFF